MNAGNHQLTYFLIQIQFRFVSVVAGNSDNLSTSEYNKRHAELLDGLLNTLTPQYIVGTCTFKADLERDIALRHKTILMAQVGPPGFYETGNPYVFGLHLNSDAYAQPALQALNFYAESQKVPKSHLPVKVIYRTESEFFRSTCIASVNFAKSLGFKNITEVKFEPFGDHDNDGVINSLDDEFLIDVADKVCSPGSEHIDVQPIILTNTSKQDWISLFIMREKSVTKGRMIWLSATQFQFSSRNTLLRAILSIVTLQWNKISLLKKVMKCSGAISWC